MKVLRFIFLILHLGIFFLLSGMLFNNFVAPKQFPWLNLLSLGFPVLLITYILLLIFWIVTWKKRAFIFLLLGLIFINPIKRWVNFMPDKKDSPDLKVVSFNIKGGTYGKEKIEEYINTLQADIVFLQEDGNGSMEYEFDGLKMGEKIPVISIFSKHKIIGQKELIIGNYDYFNAYADQTDIEIKGKIYRFINVYLQPFKFKKSMLKINGNSGEDEQKLKDIIKRLIPTFKMHQEQIDMIRKGIESSPYPVILAGDLNAVPNSYEYYHLSEGLKDAFVEVGRGSSTSFHDYKFPLRIDYIFSSDSIQPINYQVDRSVKISDHFPVIATFRLDH